ncbi:dystrophin [Penaeus vannamei]|uniref:dystrophin n=1 Tax=Penaeus vannamei TaxID=6689 RepID=UPI00387F5470
MVETLEGRVLEDWMKARTNTGIPYYVNHSRGVTQWDHPEYVRIMEEVHAVNSVKYAAYRTACKLRRLQTRLKLHEVSLQCVASTFDSCGFRVAENNDLIEVKQVEHVIQQILRTTYKNRHVHITLATQLTLNLLLNVLDKSRSGMLQVLGCKVLMVVMCAGRLQEKYRYLFTQVADHNNCCTRRRLAAILRDLARIPELLSEQPSFGMSLVSAAVESCFSEVEGEVGVTEEVLLAWLLQEPQTLVWWTTLYRLTAAELVCHDVKCGVCKQRPIIGLRYQCLRCIGYNLCQDCFLHARTSRRHKLTHPIQEYCHETTGKEWRRALLKMVRNRFGGRQGYNKQRYLAIASSPESGCDLTSLLCEAGGVQPWCGNSEDETEDEEELMSRTILHPSEDNDSNHSGDGNSGDSGRGSRGNGSPAEPTIMPTTPRQQIHSVIMHLEEGHRQLEEDANGDMQKNVEEHTQQLQTQINRLKAILQSYTSAKAAPQIKPGGARASVRGLPRLESTPIVGERGLLLNLSPIVKQPSADDTAVLDNKENHLVENPDGTPVKESRSIQPMRMPFTPRLNGVPQHGTPNGITQETQDIAASRSVPPPTRLPSFTEVNFSDLTSLTSAPSSVATSPRVEERVANGVFGDDVAPDVREELENILHQLDQIFPLCKSENTKAAEPDGAGVVEAACELGDVLAEYVNTVPSSTACV